MKHSISLPFIIRSSSQPPFPFMNNNPLMCVCVFVCVCAITVGFFIQFISFYQSPPCLQSSGHYITHIDELHPLPEKNGLGFADFSA